MNEPRLQAEDYYVNNITGSDSFNGRKDATVNAGAFKSISRALRQAKQGDRIVVEKTALPYYECLTMQGIRNSGTDYLPFQLISDGAVLDGTGVVRIGAWEHYRDNVFRFMPELKSNQRLYLDGQPAENVAVGQDSRVPDLEPDQWSLVNGWIYFCTDGTRIPAEYDLRYCVHATGITLYEVDNVIVSGFIVQGFQLDGVNAHDAVTSTVIRNCTVRGNGRSGLSVGGASKCSVDATISGANGLAQIRSEGFCSLYIINCQLMESESTGPAIVRDGGRIFVDGEPFAPVESVAGQAVRQTSYESRKLDR